MHGRSPHSVLQATLVDDPVADSRAGSSERVHVFDIEAGYRLLDALVEAIVREKITIRLSGRREAAGNAHARAASWPIISPSDAFLPPTLLTSCIRNVSKPTT